MQTKQKLNRRKLNLGLLSLLAIAIVILLCLLLPRCSSKKTEAIAPDNYIQPDSEPGKVEEQVPTSTPTPTSTAHPNQLGSTLPGASEPVEQEGQEGSDSMDEPGAPGQSGRFDATIQLFSHIQSGSFHFDVYNMFPGDSIEKLYTIEVSHKGPVRVNFTTALRNSTPEAQVLARGLSVKVTDTTRNRQLYDGPLSNLPESLGFELDGQGTDVCDTTDYLISVYLPTSAGNEYQNKTFTVDLKWWVEEIERNALSGWEIDATTGRPRPLHTLMSLAGIPATGDAFPITLLVVVLVASLAGILLLLFIRRRDKKNEQTR